MNSRKIRLFGSGIMVLCLAMLVGCQRSGEVRRAAPEPATPWTLTLAAPIDHIDLLAREPMIVEHPDGTLFVAGFGASRVGQKSKDEPTLWKSRDGGTTWARVNVGSETDGAVGNSDVDLAVSADGALYFANLLYDEKKGEGKQVSIGVSHDLGMTWKWTRLSKTRFDDRPWIKVVPDGTAHAIWNDGAGVCHAVSQDGGMTWTTWRVADGPEPAFYPYLVARGVGELAATWFSARHELLQAHAARIDVGEDDAPPRVAESQPFEPDCWRESRSPDDLPLRYCGGEYLSVCFLRKGGLCVVSPIQNWQEKRFGFSLWKLEEHREEVQRTK